MSVESRDLTMAVRKRLSDKDMNPGEEIAGGNALFHMERVSELRLVAPLMSHHCCVSMKMLRKTVSILSGPFS